MNNPTTMPYYHYFPFVGDMAEKEEPTYDPDLEGRPRRNLTKKKDLQRGASDQTEVMYNSYGVPVGKKRNDLRNYIRVIVRERVPIIYDNWRKMGIALRGFRCKLANEYILPNANNLSSLKKPPLEYEGIRKEDWKSFVDKILSEDFQMEIDRRSPSKVTPKSVTNNPKATPKSVTNNPKATPKSVTKKRTTKEPVVVKPVTARKLVLRKNTRGAVKARKENKSSQMNIFSLMIESSLPRTIMIAHDLKTF
ncbi:hypothetical protein CUMW_230060, partial [Citrus unshiu]